MRNQEYSIAGENSWIYEGKCADEDPEMFFSKDEQVQKIAKQICETCDVKAECLDFAIKQNQSGVWGGTSDKERRQFKYNQRLEIDAPQS